MKALYNRMTPYDFVTALPEEKKAVQWQYRSINQSKSWQDFFPIMYRSAMSVDKSDWLSAGVWTCWVSTRWIMPAGKCSSTHRVYQGCSVLSLSHTQIQTDKHKHMKRFALKLIKTPLLARCCVSQSNSHLWICSRICPYTEPRFPAISHYC